MSEHPTSLDVLGAGQAQSDSTYLCRTPILRPCEFVITERPRAGEPVAAVFSRVADRLAAERAEVLSVMLYGSMAGRDLVERAMVEALGAVAWPLTWVEGASCDGAPIAGIQVFALNSGAPITRVRLGSRVVASVFEDGGARHCLLGGFGPNSVALRAPAQVQQMFGNLECALDLAGFELADVVRTWFYNEDILGWYGDFNRVRTEHYANVKWRTGSIPASTGVSGKNPAGAALAVAAWAMRPLVPGAVAQEVASPLQCPAPAYGSSFARAMEINSGGWRRLLVSGTASIHPGGATAWVGNPKKQIDLTMEVIAAILESRGVGFPDVSRATAYFQHPLFVPYFERWCDARDLRHMPVVFVNCDICRDDLLFELELDTTVKAE
ncbi:MAG: translation initiation inhibitor [Verrucomicrobia bacterium]|nr:translation initiation inhibitor [Verrucomicrobiota bacterium]